MTSGAATMASARRRTRASDVDGTIGVGDDFIQRVASNRAISRALAGETTPPSGVTVGHADDPAERAADRLAARALGRLEGDAPEAAAPTAGAGGTSIRRRADDAVVGREGGDPGPEVASAIARSRGGGAPLDGGLRSSFESAMGADLSGVRVHTDRNADTLNRQLSAQAFTTGRDVYFRSGGYQPGTPQGQQTLAHELAHVVQGGGAVQRAYLDGGSDFAKATTKKTLGIKHSRSPELVAIETALGAYTGSGGGVNDKQVLDLLRKIRERIAAWKLVGKDKQAANAVGELEREVNAAFATPKVQGALYDERLAKHRADRKLVDEWVQEGAAQTADIRLRNSCEWIMQNRTKFYVITETHDQRERYAALIKKPVGEVPDAARVYFPDPDSGRGGLYDAVLPYDRDDLTSTTNVYKDEEGRGTKGFNVAGDMIVVTEEGVAGGKNAVQGTIKHEVQHDADQHQGAELAAEVLAEHKRKTDAEAKYQGLVADEQAAEKRKKKHKKTYEKAKQAREGFEQDKEYTQRTERLDFAKALRNYKTEYRAHYYQGDDRFDQHSTTETINTLGYEWTKRQYSIFVKVYNNYPYVPKAWGEPRDAAPTGALATMSVNFRTAVNTYVNPDNEGFNKFNSVRIDDLYRALTACKVASSSKSDPSVVGVLAAVGKLDANDVAYVENRAESPMLNDKIERVLTGGALVEFRKCLSARKDKLAGVKRPKKKSKKKALVNPKPDEQQGASATTDTSGDQTPVTTS